MIDAVDALQHPEQLRAKQRAAERPAGAVDPARQRVEERADRVLGATLQGRRVEQPRRGYSSASTTTPR